MITLTTDFGLRDPFVGVMKGVILSRFPGANIVDLTHGIHPQHVAEAAFWLSRSFSYFPPGTVHVAVVDPGVGTSRSILAAEASGHVFLAPDNGLLGPVLGEGARVFAVSAPELEENASPTFHGRDIFAPLAADLASGKLRLEQLGSPAKPRVESAWIAPAVREKDIKGSVITIDRFGNLITNIEAAQVVRLAQPPASITISIAIGGAIETSGVPLVRTYQDAKGGEIVGLLGSFGTLEIACVSGDAEKTLAAGRGTKVIVTRR